MSRMVFDYSYQGGYLQLTIECPPEDSVLIVQAIAPLVRGLKGGKGVPTPIEEQSFKELAQKDWADREKVHVDEVLPRDIVTDVQVPLVQVYEFVKRNPSCSRPDIEEGTGVSGNQLTSTISSLLYRNMVTRVGSQRNYFYTALPPEEHNKAKAVYGAPVNKRARRRTS